MSKTDEDFNPFALPNVDALRTRLFLRILSVAGVAVVLCQEALSAIPLQPRQESGFIILVIAIPLVWFALAVGLPSAWQRLLRHLDLLVPLGILTLAEAVIGWMVLLPGLNSWLTPTKRLQFAALSFTISASFIAIIALNVLYAAWMTLMIRGVVQRERGDLVDTAANCWRWFLRVLGLEAIGWGVLFAGLAVALAAAPFALVLVFPAIAVGALLWNLATAAVLLLALEDRLSFWEALTGGIRASWASKGRWWKPVVLQMFLLGWVTLVIASYTETTAGGYHRHEGTNWAVNAFWTGGYDGECRWYADFMKALNAPKLPFISTVLGLAFGVLAIAVKLTIADRLWPRRIGFDQDVQPEQLNSFGASAIKAGADGFVRGGCLFALAGLLLLAAVLFVVGLLLSYNRPGASTSDPAKCMCHSGRTVLPDPHAQAKLDDYVQSQEFILTILRRKPNYAPLIPEAANFWHPNANHSPASGCTMG
jgi:hypothetical protein